MTSFAPQSWAQFFVWLVVFGLIVLVCLSVLSCLYASMREIAKLVAVSVFVAVVAWLLYQINTDYVIDLAKRGQNSIGFMDYTFARAADTWWWVKSLAKGANPNSWQTATG
jgi:hypothetical protein